MILSRGRGSGRVTGNRKGAISPPSALARRRAPQRPIRRLSRLRLIVPSETNLAWCTGREQAQTVDLASKGSRIGRLSVSLRIRRSCESSSDKFRGVDWTGTSTSPKDYADE